MENKYFWSAFRQLDPKSIHRHYVSIINEEQVDELFEKMGAAISTTLEWVKAEGLV